MAQRQSSNAASRSRSLARHAALPRAARAEMAKRLARGAGLAARLATISETHPSLTLPVREGILAAVARPYAPPRPEWMAQMDESQAAARDDVRVLTKAIRGDVDRIEQKIARCACAHPDEAGEFPLLHKISELLSQVAVLAITQHVEVPRRKSGRRREGRNRDLVFRIAEVFEAAHLPTSSYQDSVFGHVVRAVVFEGGAYGDPSRYLKPYGRYLKPHGRCRD